jgi:hypothetical protein
MRWAWGAISAEGIILRIAIIIALVGLSSIMPALAAPTPTQRAPHAPTAANAPAAAPATTAPPTAEAVQQWMYRYKTKPEPARLPVAVRALAKLAAFKDPESAGAFVGFIAGVLANNPARADELIAKMLPLPPQDQWVVVRAIAYSGLPEWKALLRKHAPRLSARSVMIEAYLSGKLPLLEEFGSEQDPTFMQKMKGYVTFASWREAKPKKVSREPSPELIDTLWGFYLATGAERPIARLVGMLAWAKERESIDKLTLGNMAKYTLASNAARDPAVLAQLKRASAAAAKDVKPALDEVIEAAETTETARLRKDALASIDELKRKGPGSRRDLSVWGQVGEGAIALGCIAASALGQVQFGIPCVVGGALTSATLRYWEKP